MNDLDDLARSAAGALRDSVPDVVPGRPTPSRLPQVVAAAVVALALVVAGVAALDQEPTTGVSAGTPGVPRFVLRDLPEGMEVSGASDLPVEGFDGVGLDLWLYGTDDLAPELTVLAVEVDGPTTPTTAGSTTDPYREADGLRTLHVEDGRHIYDLASRTLDRAGLETAVQHLAFDGDGRPTGVPDGLRLLATMTEGLLGPVPLLVEIEGAGHAVGYLDDDGVGQVTVMTIEGGRDLVLGAPQAQHPTSTRLVDVRGREARLSSYPHGGTVLIWQEAAGVVVAMATTLSEPDLLAAAESLDEADDEEWAALLVVGDEPDGDRGEIQTATTSTTIVGGSGLTGTLANGLAWSITESEGTVCTEVRDPEGLSRDCLSAAEQPDSGFVEVTNARFGEPALLWGRCPPGVVGVEATGPTATAGGNCYRFFTFDVTAGSYAEVVFRDAEGQELGRLPVDS